MKYISGSFFKQTQVLESTMFDIQLPHLIWGYFLSTQITIDPRKSVMKL